MRSPGKNTQMGDKRNKPYTVVGSGMSHAQMVKRLSTHWHTHTIPNSNTNRDPVFVDVHHRAIHIKRKKTLLFEDTVARSAQ